MSYFSGKNVLITGGGSGIGRLMSYIIESKGANVIVIDISEKLLDNLKKETTIAGYRIYTYQCDISDRQSVYKTSESILNEFNHIDVLINNAGIVQGKKLSDTDDYLIEKTLSINLLGMIWVTKAFLNNMIERNSGHIVNIASAGSFVGVSGMADYVASKFGVFGFHESLRAEFNKNDNNIFTTIIFPYYINTGMFEGVKSRFPLLLPILKPQTAAVKFVNAIENRKSRFITPWIVNLVPGLRLLPVKIFDLIIEFFGIQNSMENFKGRKP